MKGTLFVGGPMHGQTVATELDVVRAYVPEEVIWQDAQELSAIRPLRIGLYVREPFMVKSGERIEIFMWHGEGKSRG